MADRLSILTQWLERVILYVDVAEQHEDRPDLGIRTWSTQFKEDLAKLKPRKEKLPDPISLDMVAGKWAGITDADRARWAELFPETNIQLELRKAATWVLGHPNRAKERWTPFLVRWFGTAQKTAERLRPSQSTRDKWDEVEARDDRR